jgi:hypothetical protein
MSFLGKVIPVICPGVFIFCSNSCLAERQVRKELTEINRDRVFPTEKKSLPSKPKTVLLPRRTAERPALYEEDEIFDGNRKMQGEKTGYDSDRSARIVESETRIGLAAGKLDCLRSFNPAGPFANNSRKMTG